MTVPLHYLEAMEAAGCSAAQIVAVIRADREHEIGEICWQTVRTALEGESGSASAQSPVHVESPVQEATTAGEPARPIALSGKAAARYGLLHDGRLRPAARAVGAVLLDRFNLTTGRCDPGLASLAAATGRTERSVRRAVAELEAAGLFKRVVHGGARHRNAYVPAWTALEEETRQTSPSGPGQPVGDVRVRVAANRTLVSGEADSGVLQNLREETDSRSVGVERPARANKRVREVDRRQPQFLLPITGRQAVAEAGAARRVMDAVMAEASRSPGFNVSGLTPADWDDVHAAETAERGKGLERVKELVPERTRRGVG